MKRRGFLAAGMGMLAAPALAQKASVLKVIPEADLAILDPVWTTATVTRDHAFLIFDTLYGYDEGYNVQPQMVAGHVVEEDGRLWTLTLREGLRFHDGAPVLARDVVASIRRWAQRASMGQSLLAATDALEAPDDRTVRFRLKKRFPVSLALADSAVIMPARLAGVDAFTQVQEMVGSGPFRFLAGERVAGAFAAYERFAGYVPRADGVPSQTAGPKIARIDRVEWHVIPDSGTAASAMLAGEMDWWEAPPDYLAQLRKSPKVRLEMLSTLGSIRVMRFNHLHPPFDNPLARRAMLHALRQQDFLDAVTGGDPALGRTWVGVFPPGTAMASDVGLEIMSGPPDFAGAKRLLAEAGYRGEKIVLMHPADQPEVSSNTLVGADAMAKAGLNIDLQTMDWGTLMQRRAKQDAPAKGGWNLVFTGLTGSGTLDPSGHIALRGNGLQAWAGWPTMPRIEELRAAWFDAPDVAAQKAICVEIQKQFWLDVPYVPLCQRFGPTAVNVRVRDVPRGMPLFYGMSVG